MSQQYPHHHYKRAPLRDGEFRMTSVYNVWPKYSTDWSAAGLLLEAMGKNDGGALPGYGMAIECVPSGSDPGCRCGTVSAHTSEIIPIAEAPTPQLAIARACAVLVARGVTREEVEGE
jgi:hypothetical protein